MPGYEWYVWGSQWWHWFLMAAVIAFLGFNSRTIWGRLISILGAVFTAWLGAVLLAG